jgi:hypothetical protein
MLQNLPGFNLLTGEADLSPRKSLVQTHIEYKIYQKLIRLTDVQADYCCLF